MKTPYKKWRKPSKAPAHTLEDLVAAAHHAGVKITPMLEPFLQISVSPKMLEDFRALVETGLFGSNPEEAARRILEQWLIENLARVRRPASALRSRFPS